MQRKLGREAKMLTVSSGRNQFQPFTLMTGNDIEIDTIDTIRQIFSDFKL